MRNMQIRKVIEIECRLWWHCLGTQGMGAAASCGDGGALELDGVGRTTLSVLCATELSTLKWLILCCHFHLKVVQNVEEDILMLSYTSMIFEVKIL